MGVGQFIGPYQILRQINRGGQGRVLLGYDPRLHRRVAIKIYSLPMDRRGKKQALAEARLIAGLDSPRIVRIFDVIVVTNHLAMVMEYVPGCDLEEVLHNEEDRAQEVGKMQLIHDALILGLKDYFGKLGFKKAILGLSGGIDSAVTAVLAQRALGKENVRVLLMPSQFSSDHSVEDARQLAINLGIQYDIVEIKDLALPEGRFVDGNSDTHRLSFDSGPTQVSLPEGSSMRIRWEVADPESSRGWRGSPVPRVLSAILDTE